MIPFPPGPKQPGPPSPTDPRYPSWSAAFDAALSAVPAGMPAVFAGASEDTPRAEIRALPGSGYSLRVIDAAGAEVRAAWFPVAETGDAWADANAAARAWDRLEADRQAAIYGPEPREFDSLEDAL
jgi:hypothetical protein